MWWVEIARVRELENKGPSSRVHATSLAHMVVYEGLIRTLVMHSYLQKAETGERQLKQIFFSFFKIFLWFI